MLEFQLNLVSFGYELVIGLLDLLVVLDLLDLDVVGAEANLLAKFGRSPTP